MNRVLTIILALTCQLVFLYAQNYEYFIINGFDTLPDTTCFKNPFKGADTSGYTELNYSIQPGSEEDNALEIDWKVRAYETWGGQAGYFYICDDPSGYYDFSEYEAIIFYARNIRKSTNPGAVECMFLLCDGGGATSQPWNDSEIWYHQIMTHDTGYVYYQNWIDLHNIYDWDQVNLGTPNNGQLDPDSIRGWGLLFSISGSYFGQENDTAEGVIAIDKLSLFRTFYPPEAYADWAWVRGTVPVEINILENDTDGDNDLDSSSVTITKAPQLGEIISINPQNGIVTYQANQVGTDRFFYTVSDKEGHISGEAQVEISIEYGGIIANPDIYTIDENQPVDIFVWHNEIYGSNDILFSSLTNITSPQHGQITHIDTVTLLCFSYTPDSGFVGRDSFKYKFSNTTGEYSFPCNVDIYVGSKYSSFERIYPSLSFSQGSGCAGWIDIENDNFSDLFIAKMYGRDTFLFSNQKGLSFYDLDIDTAENIRSSYISVNAGDYNNDGFTDLFVLNRRGSDRLLYKNNGDGSFDRIITGSLANSNDSSAYSSSWIDFNNDEFLDWFILQSKRPPTLYLNDGNGSFARQTDVIDPDWEYDSRSFAWADYDLDGDQDIFVANWEDYNSLYNNNGDGSFTRVTDDIVVQEHSRSRGCIWGDLNDDGYPDLFVINNWQPPMLYRNLEGKGFERIYFNWGPFFGDARDCSMIDIDNDGDLDIYVSNINFLNNDLYLNPGDGSFEFVDWDIGNIVSYGENSGGNCWSDYNRDGFLDLFVSNEWGDENSLFRNKPNGNHWINIKLKGTISNASAIGAKVRLMATINGKSKWQTRVVNPKTGSNSWNSLNVHFGLGNAKIIDTIIVEWPSGYKRILKGIPVNQFMEIEEVPAAMQFVTKTTGSIEGGVTSLGSQSFYVPSTGDQVYRFDQDGNIIYTLKVNGDIKSSTTLTADHTLYITSTDYNLYSFNANGVTNYGWPVAVGSEVTASVAIDNSGNIYVGTENGIYQAISKEGRILWSYQVSEPVHASSVISDSNVLYVINKAGRVFAFDLENINPVNVQYSWIYDLGEEVTSSPALDGASNIYITTLAGSLYKLNNTGNIAELVWRYETGSPIESSPILYDGRVIFGCNDGYVYSVNEITGTTNWTFNMKAPVKSTGAAGSGRIFFGSSSGDLVGLSVNDGSELFRFLYDGSAINCPILLQDDKVYYGTEDGLIISLSVGGVKKAGSSDNSIISTWLTFQGNNMRTGNLQDTYTGNLQEIFTGEGPVIQQLTNSPNPFGEITVISFLLTTPSDIEISIYDGKGILIDQIKKQPYTSGYHTVKWDASLFSPGVYYYTVSNGKESAEGKMSVIR